MNIGDNIKKARQTANVTQYQLAELIGAYQKDISRWEKGERTPSIVNLREICQALNVSADEILELK